MNKSFQIVDMDSQKKIKPNKALAREYAEGSDELYQCLLKLWNNGFETIGCCTGHNGNGHQYIGFNVNDKIKKLKLLSSLSKDDVRISFSSFKNLKHCSIKKHKTDIYNNVLQAIEGNEEDKTILKILEYVLSFNGDHLNIHLYYSNQKLNIYIVTNDKNLITKLKEKYKYIDMKYSYFSFRVQKEY